MVTVIIAAAGQGKRMGKGTNKVFLALDNRPLLMHTLDIFEKCGVVDQIIVVVGEADVLVLQKLIVEYGYRKITDVVEGGAERQHSISNALHKVSLDTETILIHDGARPLITEQLVRQVLATAQESGAAIAAVPVKDTIKVADKEGFVVETPERAHLWAVQTPQAFRRDILHRAYQVAEQDGCVATDDAGLVERIGMKVRLVMGDYNNLKITTPEDLIIAEAVIKGRKQCE